MKIERTKNAARNIFFGFILKAYQMVVPFAMRTIMIYFLGVQYLGLNSLFASVLQVLNLAELGVSSAMVYSMYKPIVADDEVTICALMKLYRTYYRVIGAVIALVGGAITPFVPYLISGEVPVGINIYILYLLNLGATVLSYWLFAYKNSILQAHQRNDVVSKVLICTNTLQYAAQIFVLCVFRNYYLYVIVLLTTQVITNIVTAIVANKLYPKYKPQGNIDKELKSQINRRIKDLFTSKVGAIVYDSCDTIVISAFLGLTVLAIYQNYFFIVTSVTAFTSLIFGACTAGVGNSLVLESENKNFEDFTKFTMITIWISGFCSVCMLCLFQPFMELWVGKDLMLSLSAVVCFVVYYFVRQLNSLYNLYKDASGIWHEDRFRPLAAAGTNLILNLLLVNFLGVYGILISTVVAILCVGMPWILRNLFSKVFDRSHMRKYLKKLAFYVLIVTSSAFVTFLICTTINFNPIFTFILRLCVCLIIPNVIYFVAFKNTEEFKNILLLCNNLTKGKIKKLLEKLGLPKQ